MSKAYAVIMAGGKGERFWPLSTPERPKQLLDLVGDKALIAQAVDRLDGLMPLENIFVITNQQIVEATAEAAPKLLRENIIGEPIGRDTAAAVAAAGALIKSRDPEAVFAILTADQVMGDLPLFQATLKGGFELAAREEILLTIGIKPTFAATGFGYIEQGKAYAECEGISFVKAERFVEKPDEQTAQTYVESGKYAWNAGMFIWSIQALEKAFQTHCPEMAALMDDLYIFAQQDKVLEGMEKYYPACLKTSIDYALMEKADNIVMACGTFKWDDVGSWRALENHFKPDVSGNVILGESKLLDAADNIIYSKNHLTALIGVDNLVVVQADGVTLICPKERAEEIKKLIST
jgi:mannose-1-phosphate guanylyltransferase